MRLVVVLHAANRLGFELGKRWISEHPKDFLVLGVKKLGLLLQDDRYGAYWGVMRGGGGNHTNALKTALPSRVAMFHILNVLSWIFWLVIIAIVARKLMQRHVTLKDLHGDKLLPLIYPILYCAAVFFVFESDRRQHMIALALLIVLATGTVFESLQKKEADILDLSN